MRYSNDLKKKLEHIYESYSTEQGFVLDKNVQERLESELKKVNTRIDDKLKGYDDYQMLDVMFDFADKLNDIGFHYREGKGMTFFNAIASDDTFRFLWEFADMVRETSDTLNDYCEDHNIVANPNIIKVSEIVKKSFSDYLENCGQKRVVKLSKPKKKEKSAKIKNFIPDFDRTRL